MVKASEKCVGWAEWSESHHDVLPGRDSPGPTTGHCPSARRMPPACPGESHALHYPPEHRCATGSPRLARGSLTPPRCASEKRNDPPGKPGALLGSGRLGVSEKRNDPPGKPGAFDSGNRARRPNPKSTTQTPQSGFTLVELLVTITIITMLAGMVLGGLRMARTAAREMKTKATIAKLDEIVMRMYAGYAHRRVPIDTTGMTPLQAAQARLFFLRRIVQWEMPDRYGDVELPSGSYGGITMAPPALTQAYGAYMTANPGADASAQCLYMIVSIAHPRELEHFSADEIGTLGGYPVFVDAWGNPIRFIRWPGQFVDSDIQPPPGVSPGDTEFVRDPFDVRGVDTAAKRLPLVYSSGPDGRPGINPDTGAVIDGARHDNIHNHRLEIR